MRRFATGALLAVAALALGACKGVQTMLDPAADQAGHVDLIWRTMLVVCGFMYLLVLSALAWALIRARRPAAADPKPELVGPNEPLIGRGLAGWVSLVTAGLVLLTTVSFLVDRSLAETGPDPLKIKVTANQWWWQVEYEGERPGDRFTTANELHLPLGRPAVVELTANDVIHSFWIPNLAGKTDLIPGRTNYQAITPRRLGIFRGQCAEFCGWQHAQMAFDVVVQDPQTFEAWRRAQLSDAPVTHDQAASEGQTLFLSRGCVLCHRIAGTEAGGTVGPDLTHLMDRAHIAAGTLPNTRANLQAWIADPQGVKPGANMPRVPLSGPELADVVAYLETLK